MQSWGLRYLTASFRILFLDLAPLDPDVRLNPIYALHTVPAHNVMRVSSKPALT